MSESYTCESNGANAEGILIYVADYIQIKCIIYKLEGSAVNMQLGGASCLEVLPFLVDGVITLLDSCIVKIGI